MKKLTFLILLASNLSYANEDQAMALREFGTLVGGALCGETANPHRISSCASFGGAVGALHEPIGNVCSSATKVVSEIQNKLEQLGLGQYVSLRGVDRANGIAKNVCHGPNGLLPVNDGLGYLSLATQNYISAVVTEGTDGTTASEDTKIDKTIIQVVVKILEPELKKAGNRFRAEITPERLRQQLEQWLAHPKEAMCRGDFTHGDIGSAIAKIVGC